MTLRVAAFTSGENAPGGRFRVRQLIAPLRRRDVLMREWPARLGSYPPEGLLRRLRWLPACVLERREALRDAGDCDIALFQREMVSTLATVERFWSKPAVIDVDDAIWLHQRWHAADKLARWAGGVICGNAYIAEHFAPMARTWIVPTAVDTDRFCPSDASASSQIIVWSGSSSGLPYLETIQNPLKRVLDARPRARLRVVCDASPNLPALNGSQVEYLPWRPDVEVSALQSARVGLMPMPDTSWTRGKCSFKMLTYMACGLAVAVSPYGMNAELLARGPIGYGAKSDDEWAQALLTLLDDETTAHAAGLAGREVVVRDFTVEAVADRVAGILRGVAAE